MSSVLIGIVGVILFIGLALAGALILGDDFRSASSASKAAVAMANLDQVTQAAAMYRLKTGAPYSQNPIAGLAPRFLKASSLTPLKEFGVVDFRGADGFPAGASNPAFSAGMGGASTETSRRICTEVNDVYGIAPDADGGPPYSAGLPQRPQGCFRLRGTYGEIVANGEFVIVYKLV